MKDTFLPTLDNMKEFLSAQDLVDLGIFPSVDAAYLARARKHGPPFIKLKYKILYPKQGLIEFLKEKLQYTTSLSIQEKE